MYVQVIDDEKRKTMAHFSSFDLKKLKEKKKMTKKEEALLIGQELGKLLRKKKILTVVFDRGSYAYLGRVKALCEGIRQAKINI